MLSKQILQTLTLLFFAFCHSYTFGQEMDLKKAPSSRIDEIRIDKNVSLGTYFSWMDSLLVSLNRELPYSLDEYLLVHANPWILDTLMRTDYYHQKDKGIFNEDSAQLIVLPQDKSLIIPDSTQCQVLKERLGNTHLDLNIPEFRLRIIEYGREIHSLPVRVGQNRSQYLEMAKTTVDLRTKTGSGRIIRVNKSPIFVNPKTNHRYRSTKRDDGKRTKLPLIPWLEPELNGLRYGQLIHPTTNLATLEKPSSNGCIGLRESDAWLVYYYAPLGTKVIFRYNLQGSSDEGQKLEFKDIYPGYKQTKPGKRLAGGIPDSFEGLFMVICDCR